MRHFIDLAEFGAAELRGLLARAAAGKSEAVAGRRAAVLGGRTLLMLFEKHSTRTRASFAAAMAQAGGTAVELAREELQMARGESVADTARALSGYADAVVIRALRHETIVEFAAFARCPVINGLSDVSHPCQVLADLLTFFELRGEIAGRRVCWVGDCNNVFFSWAQAARGLGFELRVACPADFRRGEEGGGVVFCESPAAAAEGAALVMTDVWVSMGDADAAARRAAFVDWSVTAEVMAAADSEALFMHCLPAHRGEEVAAEVIDGAQSAVWVQAENRLHAQKALLLELMGAAE